MISPSEERKSLQKLTSTSLVDFTLDSFVNRRGTRSRTLAIFALSKNTIKTNSRVRTSVRISSWYCFSKRPEGILQRPFVYFRKVVGSASSLLTIKFFKVSFMRLITGLLFLAALFSLIKLFWSDGFVAASAHMGSPKRTSNPIRNHCVEYERSNDTTLPRSVRSACISRSARSASRSLDISATITFRALSISGV